MIHPQIHLTDPAVQRAYDAAVKNLLDINTIPCDFSVHNATGLLDASEPRMIRAGGAYDTPWTRDSAINTWAAGRLYVPRASKNTLLAVCTKDENGDPIILPDNQTWDRIVWTVGAWQYYLATGDEEFLTLARGIVARGLDVLHKERFNAETGLYRGGSFFNDGISGYPADIYEPGLDHSFMGMHPRTETIMCLSTNCIYCEAWNILGKMNRLLGISEEACAAALAKVQGVKGRIEVVPTPGKEYTVLIDYAHTPDGLENVLRSVRDFCRGRIIALFGCGGDRDPIKRPIMGEIGVKLSDLAIITSDNPRTENPMAIIEDILKGVKQEYGEYIVMEDRRAAIRYAMDIAKKDDIIILAGKGHETYQDIGGHKYHLDEREEVAAHLLEMGN